MDEQIMRDAQILWDYNRLDDPLRQTDIAIGLGSHDIGVADYTAELYHQGWFPLIVFTGANAPTTVDLFPRGEGVHYAERAQELGVPAAAILIEPDATNTGENFTLTRDLLAARRLDPATATVISRPYQQRRAYATCRKVWPEIQIACSSQATTLRAYAARIGDWTRILNMLVGDTDRIWRYAERGLAIPQAAPESVTRAFTRLVAAGFDARLV